MRRVHSPIPQEDLRTLKAGEAITLSGTIYVARDAAHKRLIALMDEDSPLPFDPSGQSIYYAGPCPARPGQVIGSCGPTTSVRMDPYAPRLLDAGLKCMIGKGQRSRAVIDSMVKNGAVYLAAAGGAGALIAKCIKKAETVAFEELGAEAVLRLEIQDLPLIVAIDSHGNDQYALGRAKWKKS